MRCMRPLHEALVDGDVRWEQGCGEWSVIRDVRLWEQEVPHGKNLNSSSD